MINPFETPKYLEKFGLKEPPYTTNPDERYLFLTDTHQNAISMCGRLIQNREGAGLIVRKQGYGSFVAEDIDMASHDQALNMAREKLGEIVAEARRLGLADDEIRGLFNALLTAGDSHEQS